MSRSQRGYSKPLPEIRPETEEFWKATKKHILLIQRCKDCEKLIYYPRVACPRCLSSNIQWIKSSGRGIVYSYTIIHRAGDKAFDKDIPYAYAIIELDEGVRMISNLINTAHNKITIGMKVKVIFEDVSSDISLPKFEPV